MFAQQTALQYYNMLVAGYAANGCHVELNNRKQVGEVVTYTLERNRNNGDIAIELSGKYDFTVTHQILQRMEMEKKVSVTWAHDGKKATEGSGKDNLSKDLVMVLHRRLRLSISTTVMGFTKAILTSTSSERTTFYAHPCFQG